MLDRCARSPLARCPRHIAGTIGLEDEIEGLLQGAARAALAAWKQGRYEEFHEALMTYPGQLTEKGVFKTAERVCINVEPLRQDMEAPEIAQALARTQQLASALGVTGTPAFVIGNEMVPGAVSWSS